MPEDASWDCANDMPLQAVENFQICFVVMNKQLWTSVVKSRRCPARKNAFGGVHEYSCTSTARFIQARL